MASRWNSYVDRLLEAELTVAEHRLGLALARLLCGWKRDSAYLGERLLRETASLDGRSFTRARDGLVAKGLLHHQPGKAGRGNRGRYAIPQPKKKPAPERAFTGDEKPALQRAIPERVNARSQVQEKPALQRARRGRGKERTPGCADERTKTIQARAIDAYRGSGGTLTLERERGALVRQAAALAKDGLPDHVIVAAARELGRAREFPGLLKQRATEIQARGGPCKWDGLDRSALTLAQLEQCDCHACAEWADAKRHPSEVSA